MSSKLIGAASIIFDTEQRVLLVKHSYGKNNWDLPGGKSEQNESAQETAIRETLEEIGVHIAVGELTGVYYDPMYDMHHFVFLSQIDQNKTPKPTSPEILECGYYSINELPKPMSDFTYNRIQDSIRNDRNNLFHVIGPRQWIE